MWIVAGVLLGSMVLAALASLHVGPHGHGLAALLGSLAAIWLLVMVGMGLGRPLLWALLGADVVLSGGLGFLAWKGFTSPAPGQAQGHEPAGRHGIATTELDPFGVVRVGGEEWSAESLNGRIAPGDPVQVVGRDGVRVQVWSEISREPLLEWPDPFRIPMPDGTEAAGAGDLARAGEPGLGTGKRVGPDATDEDDLRAAGAIEVAAAGDERAKQEKESET